MSWRKKISIALVLTLAALAAGAVYVRARYVVPILMYHSVRPDVSANSRLEISPAVFERQMKFLRANRYNIVTVEALADLIGRKQNIPPKTIALTFDDGYRDNYINAYPVLRKYHIPATIFIVFNEVGRTQGDRLTWDEIRQMQSSGLVTIGCHTLSHPLLTQVNDEQVVRSEIVDAKRLLEERLGRPVTIFSYPGGRFNSHIRQLVAEAGFEAAVATNPGRNHPNDDVFALKRVRISHQSNNMIAFWLKTTGYYYAFKERRKK